MKILVTGDAGFIGSHVARILLDRGDEVYGVDNLNDYYEVSLKAARLKRLARSGFQHHTLDIADRAAFAAMFTDFRPDAVIHLAAQAGVRHSLNDPAAYIDSNLVGFGNVLELCRHGGVRHLVYASSSSVYGANRTLPFSPHQPCDHPMSLYAATKKANEAMAHAYAHLFSIPCTGLRFFTVYGPWGRPDMALFKFARAIVAGEPIDLYNNGAMRRDFTYIDDIAAGVVAALDHPPSPDPAWRADSPDPATSGVAPYRVLNIGNNRSESLTRYVELLERRLGRTAVKRLLPMQPGDVAETWADIDDLAAITGYRPDTPIDVGVARFVDWFKAYYGV